MKLDPDCIRDIMLVIESLKNLDSNLQIYHTDLTSIAKTDELSVYPKEEIAYTLLKLAEGGFIIAKPTYAGGKIFNFYISDLTFSGHQHLEKIRNINRWNKIKSVGSKIGDFSLEAIEKIAEGVTSAAISKYFGST